MTEPVLNERAQTLLKCLVERYIRDGQPVGSRTLSRELSLGLSPATIRNVMSDLEELGFVKAPHTSAGRIPTVKGYRLFVDSLLKVKPLNHKDIDQLKLNFKDGTNSGEVINNASSLLSSITQMAGVVTVPKCGQLKLRQVEFLPLGADRILVILVINDKEVQNRVIQTARRFSESELQQAANYLNREFAGQDLLSIRENLLKAMQATREDMRRVMMTAIEMADQVLETSKNDDYILAGQTNLMNYAEMSNVDKLKHLFEAFNTKQDILHLLDQSIHAEGIQIFIGEESGYEALDDCSVITAPYKSKNDVIGVLGVIGPTRMAYDRVIPVVDITARLLSSVLTSE